MSWFKRSPRVKEPPKHLPHHRVSPTTERALDEAKELGPTIIKETKKRKQKADK